jgi:diguanylate cyclase
VDNFREVNTNYGHPVASKVLSIIGRRIKASISSKKDYGFRTGGDEFAIILTKYPPDALEIIVKRLVNKLSELYSPNIAGHEDVLKCTFSVGVTTYSQERNQTAQEIYEEADKATYKAKERGKNLIVFYDGLPEHKRV